MIGAVSAYGAYNGIYYASGATAAARNTAIHSDMNEGKPVMPVEGTPEVYSNAQTTRVGKNPLEIRDQRDNAYKVMESPAAEKMRKRLGVEKCETCESRKYVDGSNEGDVSFKTPGHIDPDAAPAVVRAHEQEHVSNAIREGNKPDAELISATVSLKTAICPECGRTYVCGGLTRTMIRHSADGSDLNASKVQPE